MEIIKVSGPLINKTGVVIIRGNLDTRHIQRKNDVKTQKEYHLQAKECLRPSEARGEA